MTEVKSFLGLAIITKLNKKKVTFELNEDYERSFQELKYYLTRAPVIALPNESGEYEVYTDSSHPGLGCVLMQHGMFFNN